MRSLVWVALGLAVATGPRAQELDRDLLSGFWSEPGQCDVSIRAFTVDERYIWLQKEDGGWTSTFVGVYVAKSPSESGMGNPAIVIAEGYNMGGFMFEIDELTQDELTMTYLGTEDPDDTGGDQSTWVRCSPQ